MRINVFLAILAILATSVGDLVQPPSNGLTQILASYPSETHWQPNFSTDIIPIPCHSHNDYEQPIPLYLALAAGCVSAEVDIHARGRHAKDLYVGHNPHELDRGMTLRGLYLDPLKAILEGQNSNAGEGVMNGVFSDSPETSLTLLIDFRDVPKRTWDLFNTQIEDLRQKGWLTFWKSETGVVQRPVTIVASGYASFEDVVANTTYRDIFYDAPLTELGKPNVPYDSTNSYYASVGMDTAIGRVEEQFTTEQNKIMVEQIQKAASFGLKTRYWGGPSLPKIVNHKLWENLISSGASVLNVDDLVSVKEFFDLSR